MPVFNTTCIMMRTKICLEYQLLTKYCATSRLQLLVSYSMIDTNGAQPQ